MPVSISLVRKINSLDPNLQDVLFAMAEEMEKFRIEAVTKTDFSDLKAIVKELAEAQKELTEAQKRTEAGLGELTEAQKRTEFWVGELAEAQKRTEVWITELAEAQKKTEIALNLEIENIEFLTRRVEGVSNSVGYGLEDKAYEYLPKLLEKDGFKVKGELIRKYFPVNEKYFQINIFGEAQKAGKTFHILGEAKVRVSKKEIDRFLGIAKLVQSKEKFKHVLLLFVGYDFPPVIADYLKENDIRFFWSYQLRKNGE